MYSVRLHHSALISAGLHIGLVIFVAKAIDNIEIKTPAQTPSVFLKVKNEESNRTPFSVERGRQEFKQAPSDLPVPKAYDALGDLTTQSVVNAIPAIGSRPSQAVRQPEALGAIADPTQFTIGLPAMIQLGDKTLVQSLFWIT